MEICGCISECALQELGNQNYGVKAKSLRNRTVQLHPEKTVFSLLFPFTSQPGPNVYSCTYCSTALPSIFPVQCSVHPPTLDPLLRGELLLSVGLAQASPPAL